MVPLLRRCQHVEIPPLLPGPGAAAVAASREHGYEGVVAKRRSSTYQQGRRANTWLKHKNWSDIEVVVGGWRPGRGTRAGTIGSLLVGLPEETGLRYVGRVGTGFTDAALKSLAAELETVDDQPQSLPRQDRCAGRFRAPRGCYRRSSARCGS